MLCFFMIAEATDVGSGSPCNLVVSDKADRLSIFRSWIRPPLVVVALSSVVGIWVFSRMRKQSKKSSRTRLGIVLGMSLAMTVIAILVTVIIYLVEAVNPEWIY